MENGECTRWLHLFVISFYLNIHFQFSIFNSQFYLTNPVCRYKL